MDTTVQKFLFRFSFICLVESLEDVLPDGSYHLWLRHQPWLKKNSRWVEALKLFLGSVTTWLQASWLLSWVFGVAKRILGKTDHSCGPTSPSTLRLQMKCPPLCSPHLQYPFSTFITKEYLQFWRWMIPSSCDPPEIYVEMDGDLQRSKAALHSHRKIVIVQFFHLSGPHRSFPH